MEDVLTEAVTEVAEGTIGRSLEEVEAAEETEPAIIA